jgi:hypothetical protein
MDKPNGVGSAPTGATADDGVSTRLRHRRGVALLLADKAATDQIRVALSVWGLSTGTFLLLDALMLRRATRTDGMAT